MRSWDALTSATEAMLGHLWGRRQRLDGSAPVRGFDQGQIEGLCVPQSKHAELDENLTHMKFIIHLCQINRASFYLSKLLAGRHFEVRDFHLLRDFLSNY